MHIPRFRIRTMIVVVVLLAIAFWGGTLVRRSRLATRLATLHRRQEAIKARQEQRSIKKVLELEADLAEVKKVVADFRSRPPSGHADQGSADAAFLKDNLYHLDVVTKLLPTWREDAQRLGTLRQYHAELARKHERSARFPWLPMQANPPEPK